eukprot:TRINITY_DN32465_c0_g1_i1.p2 TRINITY_DN32465_c0_g1~~TRINITY_DN32465_c0_g1_i1.p2  ORF type:complete len:324 (-),score=96.30 TRINITY_DN32465_c0_g1_i1:186-1157(-)
MYRVVATFAAASCFHEAGAQLILQRPHDDALMAPPAPVPMQAMAAPAMHPPVMAMPAERAVGIMQDRPRPGIMVMDEKRLEPRCQWIEQLIQSGREEQLKLNPRYQQLKPVCEKVLGHIMNVKNVGAEAAQLAAKRKEAIEEKCAWLHKVKETSGLDEIRNEPWFDKLEAVCSGVPLAEMEDNAAGITKQKCTWFEMAKMTGKLDNQVQEPWYQELRERCSPMEGETQQKAAAIAGKLQGAYGVAKKLFGKVAEQMQDMRGNRHGGGGFDYADRHEFESYDYHGGANGGEWDHDHHYDYDYHEHFGEAPGYGGEAPATGEFHI